MENGIETVDRDDQDLTKEELELKWLNHTIKNYTIVEFLGKGGNGVVWKASYKHESGKFYAIKFLIKKRVHSNPNILFRLMKEIEVMTVSFFLVKKPENIML